MPYCIALFAAHSLLALVPFSGHWLLRWSFSPQQQQQNVFQLPVCVQNLFCWLHWPNCCHGSSVVCDYLVLGLYASLCNHVGTCWGYQISDIRYQISVVVVTVAGYWWLWCVANSVCSFVTRLPYLFWLQFLMSKYAIHILNIPFIVSSLMVVWCLMFDVWLLMVLSSIHPWWRHPTHCFPTATSLCCIAVWNTLHMPAGAHFLFFPFLCFSSIYSFCPMFTTWLKASVIDASTYQALTSWCISVLSDDLQ